MVVLWDITINVYMSRYWYLDEHRAWSDFTKKVEIDTAYWNLARKQETYGHFLNGDGGAPKSSQIRPF